MWTLFPTLTKSHYLFNRDFGYPKTLSLKYALSGHFLWPMRIFVLSVFTTGHACFTTRRSQFLAPRWPNFKEPLTNWTRVQNTQQYIYRSENGQISRILIRIRNNENMGPILLLSSKTHRIQTLGLSGQNSWPWKSHGLADRIRFETETAISNWNRIQLKQISGTNF